MEGRKEARKQGRKDGKIVSKEEISKRGVLSEERKDGIMEEEKEG
jgi:hypothetical protein